MKEFEEMILARAEAVKNTRIAAEPSRPRRLPVPTLGMSPVIQKPVLGYRLQIFTS